MRKLLAIALLGACSDTVTVGSLEEVVSMKATPNPDLDLLFVIDNSQSMVDSQASLAAAFPRMIDRLNELDDGLPNLHIGVVTSDMGTSGKVGPPGPAIGVIGAGGCTGVGEAGALRTGNFTGSFISDVRDGNGGRATNYTGELRDVFGALAQVGDTGCGFEQHLSGMRAALHNATNAGFVRPEANLAVVIIGDEDDCSVLDGGAFFAQGELQPISSFRCTRQGVTCDPDIDSLGDKTNCAVRSDSTQIEDVQPFVDDLIALKGDPRMVMVAGIVGDPGPVSVAFDDLAGGPKLAPSCTFAGPGGEEQADPAIRLSAFLDAFPGRSQLTSICSSDLTMPLQLIGGTTKALIGDPCLDSTRLADASPDPGVQPACEVIDVRDSAPEQPAAVPSCTDAAGDCFEIVADPVACPLTDDHLRVRVHRAQAAADAWTSIRCQTR